ncbi:potassium channel family protein [Staphylothermus hellenicus]|uniref:TrkA-N domain protein n=1 Tax=Staphylothermus hellenicus (strain DSM 12710 / JCM 10830 / BK20S6-10-b1 / P8) TaxID=591019 RepID=D7D989_STAHD|nr:NAD-binding protein [Staphylothermus hellenicus]ADI32335.1 TrkA-N domain protein [Staphylothermus hellenicus DSM 12710]
MKVVIAGGGETGAELAEALIKEEHDVVLIEADEKRAEELAEKLDCLVIKGNAAHPHVLGEAGIKDADVLVALTGNDRDNIIISLIAKSIGVKKIIVKIQDPIYNDLLINMGINDIINPGRLVIAQALSMLKGFDILNISTIMRSNIRLLVAKIPSEYDGKKISELPIDKDKAQILLLYRDQEAYFPKNDLVIKSGDSILLAVKANYYDEISKVLKI